MNLALFDFDGTITRTDTFSNFLRFAVRRHRIVLGALPLTPLGIGYRLGLIAAHQARPIVSRVGFQNESATFVRQAGQRYAAEVIPGVVRKQALDRIQWHQRQGDTVVVVSALLDAYLRPWCDSMGVELICTEMEECDGRLTGRYRHGDCSGPAKASRVRERYELSRYAVIYAYGDTNDDREMLELAHRKFYRWREIQDWSEAVTLGLEPPESESYPAGIMEPATKTALVYLWAPISNLLWYVETVVMGTISLLVWPFDRNGEMQHTCARWWCRMVAFTIGARIHVHGVEQVQAGQSYVYVANHSSLIDTPALFAYLPYQFKIMAKRSLFYVPFMGWHLWSSGNFPIDRGDARKTAKSLTVVIDGVRGGKSLMVFPEGTRTPNGALQEFKHGAFKIAVRAAVPIVPVAIRGTFELLPKGTLAPRPGRIDVFICPPIDTSEYSERDLRRLMEAARGAIAAKLGGAEERVGPVR